MIEIIVPSPGESITQVQVASWLVDDDEIVERDQEIVEIDSDKATFPLSSPVDGKLKIIVEEGETVDVGAIIATVEELEVKKGTEVQRDKGTTSTTSTTPASHEINVTPLAKKIIEEKEIAYSAITAAFPGKKITRKEINAFIANRKETKKEFAFSGDRTEERKKLSPLRLKLAERLVAVKNDTAMLTTFNEINMQKVLEVKEKYTDILKEEFGVGIGLISLFTKAATQALQEHPQVNSMMDGDELITPNYVDMGIAVSAPKGLMVPVIRNTESFSLIEIEIYIKELAEKARNNRIGIDDLKGGTFTITNGGVFGNLMSTPILNPPQSGILGMHKIMDRPVAINNKVEIQPMMYTALSYDHRIIDGKDAVEFLIKVKELIEEPGIILTADEDLNRILLDI